MKVTNELAKGPGLVEGSLSYRSTYTKVGLKSTVENNTWINCPLYAGICGEVLPVSIHVHKERRIRRIHIECAVGARRASVNSILVKNRGRVQKIAGRICGSGDINNRRIIRSIHNCANKKPVVTRFVGSVSPSVDLRAINARTNITICECRARNNEKGQNRQERNNVFHTKPSVPYYD